MLIGPVFTRELAIAPRRAKLYVVRTAYALGLLVLMGTAWLVLTGTQLVRDVGDLARFGMILFQIPTTRTSVSTRRLFCCKKLIVCHRLYPACVAGWSDQWHRKTHLNGG